MPRQPAAVATFSKNLLPVAVVAFGVKRYTSVAAGPTIVIDAFTPAGTVRDTAFSAHFLLWITASPPWSAALRFLPRRYPRRPGPLEIVSAQMPGYIDHLANKEQSGDVVRSHGP